MRVCLCVCVLDGEGGRVFGSRSLVVVQTAVYLTGHSDCLTGFCEPLFPTYSSVCHTGLKAEGHRFESASALLSLQQLWSVDTVL